MVENIDKHISLNYDQRNESLWSAFLRESFVKFPRTSVEFFTFKILTIMHKYLCFLRIGETIKTISNISKVTQYSFKMLNFEFRLCDLRLTIICELLLVFPFFDECFNSEAHISNESYTRVESYIHPDNSVKRGTPIVMKETIVHHQQMEKQMKPTPVEKNRK